MCTTIFFKSINIKQQNTGRGINNNKILEPRDQKMKHHLTCLPSRLEIARKGRLTESIIKQHRLPYPLNCSTQLNYGLFLMWQKTGDLFLVETKETKVSGLRNTEHSLSPKCYTENRGIKIKPEKMTVNISQFSFIQLSEHQHSDPCI